MTNLVSNNDAIPMTAFDIDAVARITGLTVSQLRRWDRSGFYHPAKAHPNRRRPGSRVYSRNDVIALTIVAKLLEAGVPLRRIAPVLRLTSAGEELRDVPERAFHVAANRVYLSRAEALAAAEQAEPNHGAMTIDVATVLDEVTSAIQRLPERSPEEIGQVIRRRAIMRGAPVISGTRIPTATIAWFHTHGYSLAEILENFPRLTPQDVDAALAFERSRNPAAPEPMLARG